MSYGYMNHFRLHCMQCNDAIISSANVKTCRVCSMDLCARCYRKNAHACVWCFKEAANEPLWQIKMAKILMGLSPVLGFLVPAPVPIIFMLGSNPINWMWGSLYTGVFLLVAVILCEFAKIAAVKSILMQKDMPRTPGQQEPVSTDVSVLLGGASSKSPPVPPRIEDGPRNIHEARESHDVTGPVSSHPIFNARHPPVIHDASVSNDVGDDVIMVTTEPDFPALGVLKNEAPVHESGLLETDSLGQAVHASGALHEDAPRPIELEDTGLSHEPAAALSPSVAAMDDPDGVWSPPDAFETPVVVEPDASGSDSASPGNDQAVRCSNCSKIITDRDLFCPGCGFMRDIY